MKKTVLTTITILLLTGCGNKIICKTSSGTISEKYEISYKEDEITNLKTEKIYKFEDDEEYEAFEKIIKHTVTQIKDENIEITYKKKNKKYTVTQKYNMQNITEEKLQVLGLSKNKTTLVELLKNNGLTCK